MGVSVRIEPGTHSVEGMEYEVASRLQLQAMLDKLVL